MHRHACGHGHYWECRGTAVRFGDSEPTVCMCLDHGVPMEQGDHGTCTMELLDCPLHRSGQAEGPGCESSERSEPIEDGWQPIQVPDNFDEMVSAWVDSAEPNIGWCLLCDSPIRTEDDLIPGTSTHNCPEGRSLEEKMRLARQSYE